MKLTAFSPRGHRLVETYVDILPQMMSDASQSGLERELTIITPEMSLETLDSAAAESPLWRNLYLAWGMIRAETPGKQLNAWRTIWRYGREIVPGVRIFRLFHSRTPHFFCLLAEPDEVLAQIWLGDVLLLLLEWAHITSNRGYLHAAGVIHHGASYVFVGHSGAGKSTISALSESNGDTVIHDDRIVIMPRMAEKPFVVTDRLVSMTPTPLKAFFFIKQDTRDYILSLEPHDTAGRLLTSTLDTGRTQQILLRQRLRQVFANLANLARHVPGYELHFRKSPDFWTVIDGEMNS